MGYKLKHIHAFKRVCKDLWKCSKERRKAGGPVCIRDVTGSAAVLALPGLCRALQHHHTATGERLGGGPLTTFIVRTMGNVCTCRGERARGHPSG
ncbi:MAG: hypothetical protein DDT38_01606 [Firmicutes bacterium]|nr:hypothetical protein [candidate division NPL-UPA2 bacterium]